VKSWNEVRQWRVQTRKLLIERRIATAGEVRTARGEEAQLRLKEAIELGRYGILGIYWPIRGEIDLRALARQHIAGGGSIALPVVVTRAAPVEFWRWYPGMQIRHDIWNIPIPSEREVLRPDAIIIPLVGFDRSGYRLGYGGGYYDRTLAALAPRPPCIGLGFADAELSTIYPQPHDIPLDLIVTNASVHPGPERSDANLLKPRGQS
jgi:5-formyltetrahydrofolate cyclo-ligase